MRVDNTNIVEVTKSNSNVEIKGNVTVETQKKTTRQVDASTGRVHSVQQTTVDKPFFSGDSASETDRIKEEAQNMEARLYQDKIAAVANGVTGGDCSKMEEDGVSVNSSNVDTVVTEMDKIKMELAKAGVDISIFGDDPSMEQMQEALGSAELAHQLEQALQQADLPATEENISDSEETLKQAADLTDCDERTVKYMVQNELPPTVEHLYKAQHSTGSAGTSARNQSVALDENLRNQVEQVIKEAGMPVNETTLGYSQWMMENDIPLTGEYLNYVSDLYEMKLPPEVQQVMDGMIHAVQEGKRPKDAVLLEGYDLAARAEAAAEVIADTTDEDIWRVVEKGQPVTIESLEAAQNSAEAEKAEGKNQPAVPGYAAEDIKYITARRQLEEIRLMMTAQANYAMLKKGIAIETKPLEELVEQLKALEQDYYKNMLEGSGIDATEENTALLAETVEKTRELKSAPAYVLGTGDIKNDTVNTWHENGKALKAVFSRAGESYETLMTSPRSDMGDSIHKAFQNVDNILEDLGLETTESNQRAVRILAYNQLEINSESIARMKAADQKVQVLFKNLSPSVVMEMIREGVNPLEMDVSQLNARAEEIKNQIDAGGEEKYSKYLWKMEQRQEITPEERDSYVGIYRLLNQIDKTDGAVIGALLNQGADLNMKNLLTAVRTTRNPGINVSVDDSFGEADAVNTQELSISQQIEASYQTDCAKEAFAMVTPEGMEQAAAQGDVAEMTPEELLWQLKHTQVDAASEEAYYQEQLQQFSMAKEAEEQVIKMLTGYDMPVTAYNVLAAGHMLNNRNGIFKTLFERKEGEEPDTDLEQVKQDILEEFAEALKTPEDMAKAHKKLAETAEHVMKGMTEAADVQSFDIRNLKILRQEIALGTKMSREENYAIPVLVADELTNVQLKIVRGTEERGRLDVLFDSPALGKVTARFQVQGIKVKGYIVSDSKDTVQKLEEQQNALQEELSMENTLYPNLDIIHSDNLELNRFSMDDRGYGDISSQSEEEYQIQTKELYGMAKAFLDTVKRLGKTE